MPNQIETVILGFIVVLSNCQHTEKHAILFGLRYDPTCSPLDGKSGTQFSSSLYFVRINFAVMPPLMTEATSFSNRMLAIP